MRVPTTAVISVFAALALGSLFMGATFVFAKVGVGIGAGEIRLDEPVKPGGIYQLPAVRIFNTGDEVTTYGMGIAYHQDNPELRPAKDWFTFSPREFTLPPGESELVSVTMTVPVKAEPGDYFAFIESGPIATNAPGTSVGVAVGTRLYFTAVPASVFQALAIRSSDFFEAYSPWSWVGLALVLCLIFAAVVRRFFSFNIAVRTR